MVRFRYTIVGSLERDPLSKATAVSGQARPPVQAGRTPTAVPSAQELRCLGLGKARGRALQEENTVSEPQQRRHSGETPLVWVDLPPGASGQVIPVRRLPRVQQVDGPEGPLNQPSIGGSLGPLPRREAGQSWVRRQHPAQCTHGQTAGQDTGQTIWPIGISVTGQA